MGRKSQHTHIEGEFEDYTGDVELTDEEMEEQQEPTVASEEQ